VSLDETVERYHLALQEFARGDPEPVKVLFSHQGDVVLANPFGPPVRGWGRVSEALDYASSRFRDGRVTEFETNATFVGADLASTMEVERWEAKVGERDDVAPFVLRVTSTFRLEDGSWKLVHRHADPISTPNPEGPLRAT
jgi:ketosteroid isomerase-like protein